MSIRGNRLVLSFLAVSAAFVGFWASVAPRSFYTSFPGLGRHWVAVDGPFNEHLVRDVGALYLGLLVLSVAAAVIGNRETARLAALVWLVFSVPHLAYHSAHLDVLAAVDQVLNVVILGASVLLAALLLLPVRLRADVTTPASAQSLQQRNFDIGKG